MQNDRKEIKMYSDFKSPYAFLAFDPAFALETKYRVTIKWKPFQLRLKGKGERSQYSEYKVRYSYLDARRWANMRGGMVLCGPLKIYDTRPALIGGLFARKHSKFMEYSRFVFEAFFKRELEVDEPHAVAKVIVDLGMNGVEFHEYLCGEGAQKYEASLEESVGDQIFGVPIFIFRKEPF